MKKRMTIQDKAEEAMKKAVKKVVEEHKKSGRPLAVWEKGRVKRIMPRRGTYGLSRELYWFLMEISDIQWNFH